MKRSAAFILALSLILSLFSVASFAAETGIVEIRGQGFDKPYELTLESLSGMPQTNALYSTVNTFPTKKIIAYSGVPLDIIFQKAGLNASATLIKVSSSDGFSQSFTVEELLDTKRFFFPNILSDDASGALEVKPMIALMSGESPDSLSPCEPTLVMGQRAITEQTNPYFCKYVATIEALTDAVSALAPVTASPSAGIISENAEITLTHSDPRVKIYYTLDGSEPTIASTLYNPSAASFQPELNKPVKLAKGGTIKAIAVLPGKLNSPVSTFSYTSDPTLLTFSDLSGYDWAEEAIYGLVSSKVINGMGGSKFEPGGKLTRAQFAKMIVLAVDGAEPAAVSKSRFPDVSKGAWHINYVERAAALGLIEGYTDGTFRPEKNVSREEMYAILVRAMGLETAARALDGKGLSLIGYESLESISSWAVGYVEMAEDLELVEHGHIVIVAESEESEKLSMNGKIAASRAEAAESVFRLAARLSDKNQATQD